MKPTLSLATLRAAMPKPLAVRTPAELKIVANLLTKIKTAINEIKSKHKSIIVSLHAEWKQAKQKETDELAPYEGMRETLNMIVLDYQKRKQAEIESEIAREARRLETNAKRNEANGKADRAEEYREELEELQFDPIRVRIEMDGVSLRTNTVYEVTDFAAFVRFAATHPKALACLEINARALAAFAAEQDADILFRAGIEKSEKSTLVVRS